MSYIHNSPIFPDQSSNPIQSPEEVYQAEKAEKEKTATEIYKTTVVNSGQETPKKMPERVFSKNGPQIEREKKQAQEIEPLEKQLSDQMKVIEDLLPKAKKINNLLSIKITPQWKKILSKMKRTSITDKLKIMYSKVKNIEHFVKQESKLPYFSNVKLSDDLSRHIQNCLLEYKVRITQMVRKMNRNPEAFSTPTAVILYLSTMGMDQWCDELIQIEHLLSKVLEGNDLFSKGLDIGIEKPEIGIINNIAEVIRIEKAERTILEKTVQMKDAIIKEFGNAMALAKKISESDKEGKEFNECIIKTLKLLSTSFNLQKEIKIGDKVTIDQFRETICLFSDLLIYVKTFVNPIHEAIPGSEEEEGVNGLDTNSDARKVQEGEAIKKDIKKFEKKFLEFAKYTLDEIISTEPLSTLSIDKEIDWFMRRMLSCTGDSQVKDFFEYCLNKGDKAVESCLNFFKIEPAPCLMNALEHLGYLYPALSREKFLASIIVSPTFFTSNRILNNIRTFLKNGILDVYDKGDFVLKLYDEVVSCIRLNRSLDIKITGNIFKKLLSMVLYTFDFDLQDAENRDSTEKLLEKYMSLCEKECDEKMLTELDELFERIMNQLS